MAKIPKKKRLKSFADELWALAVKRQWKGRCAVCGRTASLHAHHLIPRQHQATRYTLKNGICICAGCHLFSKDLSPHQNAAGWLEWLAQRHPCICKWYHENLRPKFDGTTNEEYYVGVILRLREYVQPHEFQEIVGVRFAAYLDELSEQENEHE